MERYSVITEKRPREIVLLRGSGCVYKRCAFCDYYFDSDRSEAANYALNRAVLSRVTGEYGDLEVINSGSVFELDDRTLDDIRDLCTRKHIVSLHFEAHYLYRDCIVALRKRFAPIALKMKLGLETFDYTFRENVLQKGIPEHDPAVIAAGFDEANLLFGLSGQSADSMRFDIDTGLQFFEHLCINIMCENTTSMRPDKTVIDSFLREVYPQIKENPRIDILLKNTDFGVGD